MFTLRVLGSGARHTPLLLLLFKMGSLYDSKQEGILLTVSPVTRKVFTLISVLCRPVPAGSYKLCTLPGFIFIIFSSG